MTLIDNCVAALLILCMAWQRACIRVGRACEFWTDIGKYMDIYGDNVLVSYSREMEIEGLPQLVQAECYKLGFVLKDAASSLGGYGLVWNGLTIPEAGAAIRFAKPLKLLARLFYNATSLEHAAQMLPALHLLSYYTPYRQLFERAADQVRSLGKPVHLLPMSQVEDLMCPANRS